MKTNRFMTTALMLGLLGTAATAYAAPSDKEFVSKASEAGMFEIESSQLALKKSGNASIKDFAQHMIDDHTKADHDLDAALQSSQSKAEKSDSLTSDHASIIKKLESSSGADFDTSYMRAQSAAHKDAVSLFSSYAKHGDDAALKTYAKQTLPNLQGHLTQVKQIKSAM